MTKRKDSRAAEGAETDEIAEAVPVETPAEAEQSPKAPVTALPSRTPQLTAERAFSGSRTDAVVVAFLTEEKLKHGTRKMTRAQWNDELAKFKAAPRG